MAIPVADHEAIEAQFAAQEIGQQRLVAVHLATVDRVEAGHDRFDTGVDRCRIGIGVQRLQVFYVAVHFALVDTLVGPAVAEEVLRGGDDVACAQMVGIALGTLQALDQRRAERGDDLGIFRIAFICAAPAVVARDGHGGREVPVDAGYLDLDCRGMADAAQQVGIAGRAKADIVREDRGLDHIGVAVDGIGAPDGRDDRFAVFLRLDRGKIHLVGIAKPFGSRGEFIAIRAAVATIEIAAETIAAHVFGRERVDLRLDQLRDLAFKAHARKQVGDTGVFGHLGDCHWSGFDLCRNCRTASQGKGRRRCRPKRLLHCVPPRPHLIENVINREK